MKKIVLILIPVLGILSACNSYLDMTPKDSISDKVMWSSTESAEYAVNSIYSYAYDIYASWPSAVGMTEAFTDEFKYGSYVNFAYCLIPSQVAYGGTNLTNSFVSVYLGCWGELYNAIRRTNEAIDNLHNLGKDLPQADQVRLEGELRLMRGWLYFELVKRYKDVILYDEDLTQIAVDKALSTEADGWDFIWKDLDYAAGVLPEKSAAKGRLDKGTALALISRSMLYAGQYDKVIAAADQLKELGYSLMKNYEEVFTVPQQEGNTESILQYSFSYADNITHEFDYYYAPGGDYKLVGQQGGGYGTPTQEMVESYELSEGGFPDWSPWHAESGTLADPPYERLEPRFHATVLYNGASWKDRSIEPFVGGGAVYFDVDKTTCCINDKSMELINLYNSIKERDTDLIKYLQLENDEFTLLGNLVDEHPDDILLLYNSELPITEFLKKYNLSNLENDFLELSYNSKKWKKWIIII